MERKIVDLMENINLEMIEEVELAEKEIYDLSRGANMERIFSITQKKISEAPKRKSWYKFKRKRIQVAVAAILVLCLSGTVFAIHQWYLEDFFGKNSAVPEDRLDRVLDSQVSDGVKMTLAEVIAGEEDANVIVYFERENGEPFPESTDVAGLEFNLNSSFKGQQAMNDVMIKMLDNNHKLAYCYNISSFQSILGKTLNIDAGCVFYNQIQKKILDIDLAKRFAVHPIRIETGDSDTLTEDSFDGSFEKQAQSQSSLAGNVKMPLSEKYPNLKFAGIGFINGELGIATYIESSEGGNNSIDSAISAFVRNTVYVSELKDSRTGKIYRSNHYSESNTPSSERTFAVAYFEDITEEDLPYLVPTVKYELPKIISDGRWNFTYTFKKEESWKSADTDFTINIEAGKLKITRISASTLGITLQGEWMEQKKDKDNRTIPEEDILVKAVMKDGSKKEFEQISSLTHYKGVYYKGLYGIIPKDKENAWQKQYINDKLIKDIKAIEINGNIVKVKEK
ncbi:hypothetical protein [Anaerovorax odorimutans]|uniref:hypothetical protein n=1 Tax=Anaerovorax odorimutans TaxID=109327 RepID=UPI0003F81936|nr:hypothetical protein [Anaerovorax odorimutans]